MNLTRTHNDRDHYAGCRLFTSATGLSGFALGEEGEMAGWLHDFFASPHESEKTVRDMVALAVQQGADKLVTYEHPLLAEFFISLSFQPTNVVRLSSLDEAPPGWVPEVCRSAVNPISCPDFLNMMRVKPKHALPPGSFEELKGPAAYAQLVELVRRGSAPESAIAPNEPCARCGQPVPSRIRSFGVIGGYQCAECGFVHAYGNLTLKYPVSVTRPRPQPCPCGSGKAFSECHGVA